MSSDVGRNNVNKTLTLLAVQSCCSALLVRSRNSWKYFKVKLKIS